jgi:hypothetical protein
VPKASVRGVAQNPAESRMPLSFLDLGCGGPRLNGSYTGKDAHRLLRLPPFGKSFASLIPWVYTKYAMQTFMEFVIGIALFPITLFMEFMGDKKSGS